MPPKKRERDADAAAPREGPPASVEPATEVVAAALPPKPCGRTRGKLDDLQKEIEKGTLKFSTYFYSMPHKRPDGTEGTIDRCNMCF
jgi:hypothetical protein